MIFLISSLTNLRYEHSLTYNTYHHIPRWFAISLLLLIYLIDSIVSILDDEYARESQL